MSEFEDAPANDEASEVTKDLSVTEPLPEVTAAPDPVPKKSSTPKRALIALLIVAAVGIPAGILGFSYADLNNAEVQAPSHIEYAKGFKQSSHNAVSCTSDRAKLEVMGDVDVTKVGAQELSVRIIEGPFSKETTANVLVKDTKPPVISLKTSSVTITLGDEPKAADIVDSVADPVDGELGIVTAEPEARGTKVGEEVFYDEGWYLVDIPKSLDKGGSYKISVVACDKHGNKATEEVDLTVKDPLDGVTLTAKDKVIEYAKGSVDSVTLVTCSDKDAKVQADKLDVSKVGKKKVAFKLTKGKSTHDVTVAFTVKDTKKPTITLKAAEASVSVGSTPKAADLVKAVADPVDGALELVDKEPKAKGAKAGEEVFYDKGWYLIKGLASKDKVGSYKATVVACDRHGNKATSEVKVNVVDPFEGATLTPKTTVLEYSNKPVDPATLVTCSVADAKIEASGLDLSSVGEKTVTYKLTKGTSTREFTCTFTVRDTKSPVISLNNTACTVERGTAFDPYANVRSVTDEVDGALVRVDAEPAENGNGWYTVTGSYDVNNATKYFLTVVACDKNGNRVQKEFTLEVKEPVTAASDQVTVLGDERDYVLNTNTMKFHYPGCNDVERISDEHRRNVYMSREKIVSDGYDPCGHCNP